jgi:hypothetical protein
MNLKPLIVLALFFCSAPLLADDLSSQFVEPPASARPWVYWFWVNNNVTRKGITADLEAMQRVGIGGVLIMAAGWDGAPKGNAPGFPNDGQWTVHWEGLKAAP